jgi:hypothetical protein
MRPWLARIVSLITELLIVAMAALFAAVQNP